MVDVGSVSGPGPRNPGQDPGPNRRRDETASDSLTHAAPDREDHAPKVDAIARIRAISEEINRLQGEIHGAATAEDRVAFESALAAQQIAMENILCVEASSSFDPAAMVTDLNRKLKEGGALTAPAGVGRLLQEPGQ